jgi:hypothetical protein
MSFCVPYEMPAVCVRRSRTVIGRLAGTNDTPVPMSGPGPGSLRVATVVLANVGTNRLTGSFKPTFPSSTSMRIAALVIAFVCDAMRKMVSVVIRRPASLSRQPNARSYTCLPSRSTSATTPATRFSPTYC